jgi:hypothetical protein
VLAALICVWTVFSAHRADQRASTHAAAAFMGVAAVRSLRALGFVRRQSAPGRLLNGVGMLDVPTTPALALLALVAVAGLSTALISLVPGAWAARARPARLLRVE